MLADEAQMKEVKEDSVKVAAKKHEASLISEQSKLIDLQTLLDSREEVNEFLSQSVFTTGVTANLVHHCMCPE